MYKLHFILKQHSPLIHFQHDQEGATLRATEVKPKLDKFMIEQFGEKIKKNWYNNVDHGSLNYKLRILPPKRRSQFFIFSTNENNEIIGQIKSHYPKNGIISGTQYFADNNLLKKKNSTRMNDNGKPIKEFDFEKSKLNNAKLGLFYTKIECQIICFDESLKECIKKCLASFFVFNNFGNRQSKGFGCFTIEKIDNELNNLPFDDELKKAKKDISVFKTSLTADNMITIIEDSSKAYKILKSGMNTQSFKNPVYVKSLLFIYFCEKEKIRWEKRWIKQKAKLAGKLSYFKGKAKSIDCDCNKALEVPTGNNYKYVRGVLGIAETNEFLKEMGSEKFIVEIKNASIDRYQSPILIKINNKQIYFICKNNFDLVKDKPFNFKLFTDSRKPTNLESDLKLLNTPSKFNLKEFMNWCNTYMQSVSKADARNEKCKDDLRNYLFEIEDLNPDSNEQ